MGAFKQETGRFVPGYSSVDTTTDNKDGCGLATTSALPANTRTGDILTADVNGIISNIDSIPPVVGQRVLIKDEVNKVNNGIYVIDSVGSAGSKWSMTRAEDANSDSEVTNGMKLTISGGITNILKTFLLISPDPITVNVSDQVFAESGVPREVDYSISFVDIEEVPHQFGDNGVSITSIIKSSGVDVLTVDINGGGFNVPVLPLAIPANAYVIWQITYAGGADKASINVKGTI